LGGEVREEVRPDLKAFKEKNSSDTVSFVDSRGGQEVGVPRARRVGVREGDRHRRRVADERGGRDDAGLGRVGGDDQVGAGGGGVGTHRKATLAKSAGLS